ncbi:hypothetical protein [Halodesulfovibrio aestuarii]|uniref:hypothetical protein n=1 Tax=Halodesulfovibrio aestuarii TaxID=126333 RepID=UPI003D324992
MKRFVALALVVVFCLPLAGCEDFSKDCETTIKVLNTAHNGVITSAAIAYKYDRITKKQLQQIRIAGHAFDAVRESAIDLLDKYVALDKEGKDVEAEGIKQTLLNMLPTVRQELGVLRKALADAKDEYQKLKDGALNEEARCTTGS